MVEVYGTVPEYKGIGRPPTRKRPQSDWQYLQAIKEHENGCLVGIKLRVVYGVKDEVLKLLGKSTAYIERTHLTMRLFNGRLTRKTLAFSKRLQMYRASAAWDDLVYNLMRPLKTLRVEVFNDSGRRWKPCTPAMAAGLVDCIWTVKDVLKTVVIADNILGPECQKYYEGEV